MAYGDPREVQEEEDDWQRDPRSWVYLRKEKGVAVLIGTLFLGAILFYVGALAYYVTH